jgi:hypothetical protein
MRTALIMLLVAALFSCEPSKPIPLVIRSKSYIGYYGEKLPNCICAYKYSGNAFDWMEFQDSCSRYKILDTLK